MHLLSICLHRCLPALCALSFSLLSRAQDVAFAWGRSFSSNGTMWNSSTTDAAGNTYTVGSFTEIADFDPGPNTVSRKATSTDAFISKLDAAGNYVWVIQLGGSAYENIYDIALDAQGNIYINGYAGNDVDFDPGPGVATAVGGTGFTAKYDAGGNLVWVSREAGGIALAVDASQNVYITGYTTRATTSDPTVYSNDTYICKLNSNGVLQWQEWVGGDLAEIAWSIAVDGNGNAIVSGSFASATLDLDPGPGVYTVTYSGDGFDSFLIKVDPNGNFIWGGALTAEYPYDIKTDAANNVYITGLFAQTTDFDPGPGIYNLTTPDRTTDAFICKLTSDGNLAWAKQLAGTPESFSYGKVIALDAAGNVYTAGYMAGSFDMDPGASTAMATSVAVGGPFVSKLDANGNYVWGKVFGGTERAQSYGIGLDLAQNVYITGYFYGTLDLDPGTEVNTVTATHPFQDIFISKLSQPAGGSLPLTWLNIKGQLNNNQQAVINWKVSEINVQGYTIEKSTDGQTFNSIGSLSAKGDGTQSYVFTEEATLQQSAWYRILQTDVDGHFSYSTIIHLEAGNARPTVSIFPVPARDQVTISLTGDELLHTKALLVDRSGRPLKAIYLNKQQTQLPVGDLAAGVYFLQLANKQTMTIMVQN